MPMKEDAERNTRRHAGKNRLQFETSPYLLQHADNPVDWFPWSDEAFRKAAEEDKPVFLSIGYSSCHWCHVMGDESFSQPEVAALLNTSFVSVKVDREERPDVDQAYMAMAQAVTGQGGWPLTVIMTPDGKPFFLGTYLPRHSAPGRLGLLELLPYVTEHWRDSKMREELLRSATSVVEATRRMVAPSSGGGFPADAWGRAFLELAGSFDALHGGFGSAPKFPTPSRLSYLLRYWKDTSSSEALDMVTKTLDEMRLGGVYDHLDSGFHRYSVDRRWAVPHFEKMLYDQALLVEAYLDAHLVTGNPLYASTVHDVLSYVQRRLTAPGGAFYCAEDADTRDGEGAYYLWTVRQLREALSPTELRVVLASSHITPGDAGDVSTDALDEDRPFVLAFGNPLAEVSVSLGLTLREAEDTMRTARNALLAARQSREPVMVDDKVSADWNGLAITAFARAGRALGNSAYVDSAARAADFVMTTMVNDGVLMHTFKDGTASVPGFLDDYAFMARGLFDLFQATQRAQHLRWALHLVDQMVALFWDEENGGFYQAGRHGETLVVRVRPTYDGALPSGNAVAGMVLALAARLTGRVDLDATAERLFAAVGPSVAFAPGQYTSLLMAHRLYSGKLRLTTVVGEAESSATVALLRAANEVYAPDQFLLSVSPRDEGREVEALLPVARGHEMLHGRSTAYVCTRSMCAEPTADPDVLRGLIG
jgi:hypothetical protein